METKLETITPERALNILQNNAKNRKLDKDLILFYANQMEMDEWKVTGQGISISDDNQLIDGQNRLAAIVKSRKPQTLLVCSGLSYDEVSAVYDTGKSRTAKDVLYMNDVKNPDKLSAAIRLKFILDSSTFFNTRLKITNTNIRDEYIANKSVYDFHMTNSLLFNRKYKIIPVSNICGICCHLEIKKSNDRKKIISFFSELYGMTESTNQVIELLRSILVNNLSQREKLSADTRVKYICKAWNAYISNDTYKKLNVTKADKLLFL